MIAKKDKTDQKLQLTTELQRVRQESLAASRRNDFRTVARLTLETARLNRQITAADGSHVPSLEHLCDQLFTSDNMPSVLGIADHSKIELEAA